MDENVHAVHTAMLLDELARCGKPYRLLLYPNERHGLRALHSQLHFEREFFRFFLSRLLRTNSSSPTIPKPAASATAAEASDGNNLP
mmetsp:Transcript_16212/g.35140  ORF Transcript_16212/g.35140 Transcript_16212/m.35140 type:complete len:87 (+) Transcript_16212:3-263(+)